jgi:hypothetical protein
LPEAGAQGLHDIVDHAVASPPRSLPGELSMNQFNTSVGGSVASRDTSLAKGVKPGGGPRLQDGRKRLREKASAKLYRYLIHL